MYYNHNLYILWSSIVYMPCGVCHKAGDEKNGKSENGCTEERYEVFPVS